MQGPTTIDVEQRVRLARAKMDELGLQGWQFRLDNARARTGQCSFSRRCISLSRYFVAVVSDRDFLNTLLHEIAHAIAGFECGHGPRWMEVARSIGCDALRCYSRPFCPKPYVVRCACGAVRVGRYRVSKRLFEKRCERCHGALFRES